MTVEPEGQCRRSGIKPSSFSKVKDDNLRIVSSSMKPGRSETEMSKNGGRSKSYEIRRVTENYRGITWGTER